MANQQITPATLARELDCDVDDVLIRLWGAGLTSVVDPQQRIRPQDARRAESACGLISSRARSKVDYWCGRLGMSRSELSAELAEMGVTLTHESRKLPKGALAKLERAHPDASLQSTVSTAVKPAAAPHKRREAVVWREIGHPRTNIQYLTPDNVKDVHFHIADDFADSADPISPVGVREISLLESACARPETALGEVRKYGTVEMAAAALMHSVVHNHAFYNGNKRTALVSTLSFLDRNGFTFNCDQDDLFRWTVQVAAHSVVDPDRFSDRGDAEVLAMSEWIVGHTRPIEVGERVITWARLRHRLSTFDCICTQTGNNGGRIQITRHVKVQEKSFFRTRERQRKLRYVAPFGGEGREVGRMHLKEMRVALELSNDHGVDSAAFYGSDPAPVDEFIGRYRKTLARLART